MAECCVCGKKMGMFEGNSISIDGKMSSYSSCAICSKKIKLLRTGDAETYLEFQELFGNMQDECLKEYLRSIMRTPEEKDMERIEKQKHAEIEAEEQKRLQSEFEKHKQNIILTSIKGFEGYKIVKYIDMISGECVLGTGLFSEVEASLSDLTGSKSDVFTAKLKEAKEKAVYKLKEECFLKGGNAIIGVEFDYFTFANNMVGVAVNGTTVIVEKE